MVRNPKICVWWIAHKLSTSVIQTKPKWIWLKGPIRQEEQSEKTDSFHRNLLNEVQLKGPQREKQPQEQN